MADIFREPPLDKYEVGKWRPKETLVGVCWLWNATGDLLEVLATADLQITLSELEAVRSGPRTYVHSISFDVISDQQSRDQRVQFAIERYKPMHQTSSA
jgi:hypothetical protein